MCTARSRNSGEYFEALMGHGLLPLGFKRIPDMEPPSNPGRSNERRLEEVLESDISIVSEPRRWMVIGRQVPTEHGGYIDLLALDEEGNIIVLELKRDKSHREVVSQVLDYASWVDDLEYEGVASIFADYRQRRHGGSAKSLQDAFEEFFEVDIPEEINVSHEMVIVATGLHPESERVVRYLQSNYGVPVNAVFFTFFVDGGTEYLSRSWLVQPTQEEESSRRPARWNREHYVSFGYQRDVVEAGLEYGFFVGGGGEWYSRSMDMLSVGDRVWVYLPRKLFGSNNGFVGVARVTEPRQPVDDFTVEKEGEQVPITSVVATSLGLEKDDPDKADYAVRLEWIHVLPIGQAVWEKGFLANQNTVARPTSPKWDFTVRRLKTLWHIEEE